jgi:hypothetical protein
MRFSVRTLLIFTAVAAGFCGLFSAVPDSVSAVVLSMVTIVLLASAVILTIVARGASRMFGLGYAVAGIWFPLYFGFVVMIWMQDDSLSDVFGPGVDEDVVFGVKCVSAFQIMTSTIAGLLALVIRWYWTRANAPETPGAISIDPRDMAELYAVLQGRMTSGEAQTDGEKAAVT